jgi:hypothetical protein
LKSELDEERRRSREVVDHDAHVLHALDRHALDSSDTLNAVSDEVRCSPDHPRRRISRPATIAPQP